MVNLLNESLATTYMALADLTRRVILERLIQGDASVTELVRPFAICLPAICKQLHKLNRATINVSLLVYQGLFAG